MRKIIIVIYAVIAIFPYIHGRSFPDQTKTFTLENGMAFYVYERHQVPTFAGAIMVKAGSVDEREGITGMAHFIEHLLFKKQGMMKVYAENGAESLNATTWADTTQYFVKLPANRLELWFLVESTRLKHLTLAGFNREKEVILEEKRMGLENDPHGSLSDRFLHFAFMRHPYRRPVVGYSEDIRALTEKDARDFFNTHYVGARLTAALVGDVAYDEVKRLAEKYFSSIPAGEPASQPRYTEPGQKGERRLIVEYDAEPRVMIGYHMPPYPAQDNIILGMISHILAAGDTSRLYKDLVLGKGLTPGIASFIDSPGGRCPSLFTIHGLPAKPHAPAQLEQAIYEHLEKLKKEPVPKEEIDKAVTLYEASLYRGLKDNLSLALKILDNVVVHGSIDADFAKLAQMKQVTAAQIMETAERIFTNANRTTAVLTRKHVKPEVKK